MNNVSESILTLLFVIADLSQSSVAGEVLFDRDVPQVAFAASELSDAFTEILSDVPWFFRYR